MLRILTLNIGSLFESGWEQRRHEVVAWVNQTKPDVICFQEVWENSTSENTAGWIADAADGAWHWKFGGFGFGQLAEDDPAFRFGSAVLSRWPITSHNVHRLPTAEDDRDSMPSFMPWELLHIETAGVSLFSTHLAAAPTHGRHRQLQVAAIANIIEAARGERDVLSRTKPRDAMPPILCGDFNAEPESDEIRFLKGLTPFGDRTVFFQDAWGVAGADGPGYTQDWRTHPLAAELNVHRKRIDYVFVGDPFLRPNKGGRVLEAVVVADEPLTGVQASDHRGLLVDVEWPNRPSTAN